MVQERNELRSPSLENKSDHNTTYIWLALHETKIKSLCSRVLTALVLIKFIFGNIVILMQ